jgi:predicted transcriptional regulator
MKLEIVVPKDLEDFVQSAIANPKIGDVNELIVRALYHLRDAVDLARLKHDRLKADLQAGIEAAERGGLLSEEEVFDELLESLREEVQKSA